MFSFLARFLIKFSAKISRLINLIKVIPMAASLDRCGSKFRVVAHKTTITCPGELYLYGNDGEINIGDNCLINNNVQIGSSGSKITIGNNVLIAPNVVIRAADHVYKDSKKLIVEQGHQGAQIVVEDDVWICSNCVITKGCNLGKGCVIAAGSVVTKSVKPYTLAGGVPAKEIRKRG